MMGRHCVRSRGKSWRGGCLRLVGGTALLLVAASPVAGQAAGRGPGDGATAMFRGDPSHTGVYPATSGSYLGGLQWRFATSGAVTSSPVVSGDAVYVGSGDGHVYALDLTTGDQRWGATEPAAVDAAPAVALGRVFVGDRNGTFHALDAATGRELWSVREGPAVPFPWGHESGDFYRSSACVVGGVVIFGGTDGFVYALDAGSGGVRWRTDLGARIPGSPAVADSLVLVGDASGILHALDLATGTPRWSFRTAGADLVSARFGFDRRTIQSSPAVAESRVFFGARDGFLYALDLHSGRELWHVDHKVSWVNTSPAVEDGVVYDGSSDGHFVQAVDAATGREQWRTVTENIVWSSPAVSGQNVYVGDGAGWLYAFDRHGGEIRWRFRTGDRILSSPAVAGNLVVFGSDDGGVYAVQTAREKVTRVVFWSDSLAAAAMYRGAHDMAAYFRDSGYEQKDVAGLTAFMRDALEGGSPGVVVFALDYLPHELVDPVRGRPLLRAYLEAGGKVVWLGVPPLLWPRDPATLRPVGLDGVQWDAGTELLGVDYRATIFDPRTVRATAEGLRWGLEGRWRAGWGVAPSAPSRVLGLDDWGNAAAWVQEYGAGPGAGFVVAVGLAPPLAYRLAEARPLR
jgi:eukaryotic-like serine/threonine-protein kinase